MTVPGDRGGDRPDPAGIAEIALRTPAHRARPVKVAVRKLWNVMAFGDSVGKPRREWRPGPPVGTGGWRTSSQPAAPGDAIAVIEFSAVCRKVRRGVLHRGGVVGSACRRQAAGYAVEIVSYAGTGQ